MGAIEESEPPLKRAKGPLAESKNSAEDSSVLETLVCSLGDVMARPLTSQRDEATTGPKSVIKRSEFIRIITGALHSLGYHRSGALLEEESGIPLHSSIVNEFLQLVKDGKWDESMTTLRMIGLFDDTTVKLASFLILEQKYLELLRKDEVNAALHTLRTEIVPLHINRKRVHELSSCMIFRRRRDYSQDTDCAKSKSEFLEKMHKLLPASVIIPEKRLEHLVERLLMYNEFLACSTIQWIVIYLCIQIIIVEEIRFLPELCRF